MAENEYQKRANDPPPAYQPYTIAADTSNPDGLVTYYQNQGQPQMMYTTSTAPDYYGNPSVVVVTQQPPPTYQQPYRPVTKSFNCHIFWSCLAFWLCGVVFGAISFVLAISARKASNLGNHVEAHKLGKVSMSLTIIGILVGCAVWGFVIWYLVYYYIEGFWIYGYYYRYRFCYVSVPSSCYVYPYYGIHYGGCCYYN